MILLRAFSVVNDTRLTARRMTQINNFKALDIKGTNNEMEVGVFAVVAPFVAIYVLKVGADIS